MKTMIQLLNTSTSVKVNECIYNIFREAVISFDKYATDEVPSTYVKKPLDVDGFVADLPLGYSLALCGLDDGPKVRQGLWVPVQHKHFCGIFIKFVYCLKTSTISGFWVTYLTTRNVLCAYSKIWDYPLYAQEDIGVVIRAVMLKQILDDILELIDAQATDITKGQIFAVSKDSNVMNEVDGVDTSFNHDTSQEIPIGRVVPDGVILNTPDPEEKSEHEYTNEHLSNELHFSRDEYNALQRELENRDKYIENLERQLKEKESQHLEASRLAISQSRLLELRRRNIVDEKWKLSQEAKRTDDAVKQVTELREKVTALTNANKKLEYQRTSDDSIISAQREKLDYYIKANFLFQVSSQEPAPKLNEVPEPESHRPEVATLYGNNIYPPVPDLSTSDNFAEINRITKKLSNLCDHDNADGVVSTRKIRKLVKKLDKLTAKK